LLDFTCGGLLDRGILCLPNHFYPVSIGLRKPFYGPDVIFFATLRFNPNEPGVDKVEIEGPGGEEICTTVHLGCVASSDTGRELAAKVNTVALNRIGFYYGIAIENARSTGSNFSPLNPQPGVIALEILEGTVVGEEVRVLMDIAPVDVKTLLEKASPPGEPNYGLFRSALQSTSPVEEFMHLYHIPLMIHKDRQWDVDAFIVKEDPTVPQTEDLREGRDRMETVYTRLRNEFGHRRSGVDLETTKSEMANRLSGLRALVKRAIELHP
jgi:hypothetical protein